jgi:hypothetical protein
VTGALALALIALAAADGAAGATIRPVIQIEDAARFYRVYDAAQAHPTAEALQRDYLDAGTPGLHAFAAARRITGEAIFREMSAHPEIYAQARRCERPLPQVKRRLETDLAKLAALDPHAVFPPVTIAVSRGKPVAMGDAGGVRIGLEALCAVPYFDADVTDRFVHVIAHEYVHVQQNQALNNDDHPTVLERSLIEGAAEFVGEMISGGVGNPGVASQAHGHESEIETAFLADIHDRDLSRWIDNGSLTTPGDLGYWVGYRIVKAYYVHAHDKRAAIRAILAMNDPDAFLAASGWRPGLQLPTRVAPP